MIVAVITETGFGGGGDYKARVVELQDKAMVVIRYDKPPSVAGQQEDMDALEQLADRLGFDVAVAALDDPNVSIESLDETEMAKYGWFRRQDG